MFGREIHDEVNVFQSRYFSILYSVYVEIGPQASPVADLAGRGKGRPYKPCICVYVTSGSRRSESQSPALRLRSSSRKGTHILKSYWGEGERGRGHGSASDVHVNFCCVFRRV